MKHLLFFLFLYLPLSVVSAQSYKELSEQAIESIEIDSLERAEKLLLQALKLEPKNPHNALLFSNLGLVQRGLRRYDDAIESYTFALNIAPLAVPILLNRGAIYLEMGMSDRAYIDYCQVLDTDEVNAEALLMRGYIYTLRRDYKAARIDYNRLLELDEQSYSGRFGLATINQKEGKFREALDILNTLLVENPADATLYVARAGVEEEMGHAELAMIDIEEAIRLQSTLVEAYLMRGEIYLKQKKLSLARQDFEKAISLGVPQTDLHEQLKQCE